MGRKIGKVGETLEQQLKGKTKEEQQELLDAAVEDIKQVAQQHTLRASWG